MHALQAGKYRLSLTLGEKGRVEVSGCHSERSRTTNPCARGDGAIPAWGFIRSCNRTAHQCFR
jgi:hypothetical protein